MFPPSSSSEFLGGLSSYHRVSASLPVSSHLISFGHFVQSRSAGERHWNAPALPDLLDRAPSVYLSSLEKARTVPDPSTVPLFYFVFKSIALGAPISAQNLAQLWRCLLKNFREFCHDGSFCAYPTNFKYFDLILILIVHPFSPEIAQNRYHSVTCVPPGGQQTTIPEHLSEYTARRRGRPAL